MWKNLQKFQKILQFSIWHISESTKTKIIIYCITFVVSGGIQATTNKLTGGDEHLLGDPLFYINSK